MPPIDRNRWRDLEPLLDHALTLPAEERTAWLETLQAHTPELVADLTSLLSGESEADRRGFLAEPPVMGLAGLELGAYTLERPLGQGGMGSVWLARRTDGRFEGRAAVKLMNLALLSPTGQERFRREGTVLARLTHPGIARLLDAGVAPFGQPYLVIEYVDGERIDAFAAERRLSREDRIRLVLQVLEAVGHAHANLIVHRDIKPSPDRNFNRPAPSTIARPRVRRAVRSDPGTVRARLASLAGAAVEPRRGTDRACGSGVAPRGALRPAARTPPPPTPGLCGGGAGTAYAEGTGRAVTRRRGGARGRRLRDGERRRCERIRSITGGAVRNATSRMAVPQRGQRSGSTSKIRRSSAAQRWRTSAGAGGTAAAATCGACS
jgi:hypothetical protein